MEKVTEMFQKEIPQEIEIEGGGNSWWYVCPECHGPVDLSDRFCRHCGQAITKKETGGKRKYVRITYRGEGETENED